MTEQVPTAAQVVETLERLAESLAGDPTDVAGYAARVAAWGWRQDDSHTHFQTDVASTNGRISLWTTDLGVAGAGTNLSYDVEESEENARRWTDVFADYVAELATRWGKPTARKRGRSPEARWEREGAVFVMSQWERGVSADVFTGSGYAELKERG